MRRYGFSILIGIIMLIGFYYGGNFLRSLIVGFLYFSILIVADRLNNDYQKK